MNGERESLNRAGICRLLEISCRSVQPIRGFGVEQMLSLGLFAEYNLRTFQIKLKWMPKSLWTIWRMP